MEPCISNRLHMTCSSWVAYRLQELLDIWGVIKFVVCTLDNVAGMIFPVELLYPFTTRPTTQLAYANIVIWRDIDGSLGMIV